MSFKDTNKNVHLYKLSSVSTTWDVYISMWRQHARVEYILIVCYFQYPHVNILYSSQSVSIKNVSMSKLMHPRRGSSSPICPAARLGAAAQLFNQCVPSRGLLHVGGMLVV